jgi:tRNA(His) 5'-end guanylyltransferase
MSAVTLDRVLTQAEALSADERAMLEELLHKRRIEAWRNETASSARKAAKALRRGKLKPQSSKDIIAALRSGLKADR